MDLIDLLQSDAAWLPGVGQQDFEAQIAALFDEYFGEFRKVTADDQASTMARHHLDASIALSEKVLEALGAWLDGQPSIAAAAVDEGLASVSAALKEHLSVPLMGAEVGPLFRLSVVDGGPAPRSRLFHIPFQMRDRVATQRYSFPGLPCVYLGRSSYVCWVECGRPEFASSWIARFGIAPEQMLRVLDFGRTPAVTAAMLAAHPERWSMAASYAVLWPLIAACSIGRRPGSATGFAVEYVIPQLLLRWIAADQLKANWAKEVRVDGIRFFSTRVEANELGPAAMNYAFPAQKRDRTGYCQVLAGKLHLSDPVDWPTAATHPSAAGYNDVEFHLHGATVRYQDTEFSRVEAYLDTQPLHPV